MKSDSVLVVAEQLRRRVPGGIGRAVRGLLQGMKEIDNHPAITLLASRGPRGRDPLREYTLPLRTSMLPGPLLTRTWDRGLGTIGKGFSLVHATSLAAPPVKGMPLVSTVYDLAFETYPEMISSRAQSWHKDALSRALKNSDLLISASESVSQVLRERGPRRVITIGLGADHLPSPDTEVARVRLAQHGVVGPYLLTVSTLEPRKNLKRLIEAYEKARRHFTEPLPLVVVGPTGWGTHGTATHGVEGVIALGALPDAPLAALYKNAQAVAYVPLIEGYGLPPLEAMRAGAPVVASNSVPSVADEKDAPALLVTPTDVEEIAQALVFASTHGQERDALIARGVAFSQRHTWSAYAKEVVAAWETLL